MVGKAVIVAVPAPICNVAPLATLSVPVPLPVICQALSVNVSPLVATFKLPPTVMAPVKVLVLAPVKVRWPYAVVVNRAVGV